MRDQFYRAVEALWSSEVGWCHGFEVAVFPGLQPLVVCDRGLERGPNNHPQEAVPIWCFQSGLKTLILRLGVMEGVCVKVSLRSVDVFIKMMVLCQMFPFFQLYFFFCYNLLTS